MTYENREDFLKDLVVFLRINIGPACFAFGLARQQVSSQN
jgi:hypothetical protein